MLVRHEGSSTSIVGKYFAEYTHYEIVRGTTNADLRNEHRRYGYGVVPYVASAQSDDNCILLQREGVSPPALCPETVENFKSEPYLRSIVEFLRNKTLAQDTIYYELKD